jgi:hypothetical protein
MPTAVGKGEWMQRCKMIGTGEKCVLSFGELLARLSVVYHYRIGVSFIFLQSPSAR